MTTQLKVYARKGENEKMDVDMESVIENALTIVEPYVQKEGVDVLNDLPNCNCVVCGDQSRLEQVFVNLFKNAIDAMADSDRRVLGISVRRNGSWVITRVNDTGGGIESDDPKELFNAFFTTKDRGVGLGLGLNISYSIIKELGGVIEAANSDKGGAVFTVTLPLSKRNNGNSK
jgi:two-component system C4-dicarboxylate transport sensor histidine kinase DctB